MSIDEVKATVRDGNRAAEAGKATFMSASADAGEAAKLARLIVHDSSHRHIKDGLDALREAAREAERTLRRFDEAVTHANRYLASLG